MAGKVSILKRNGLIDDYSSYGNARDNAVSGDLIQIWATLNEQIILLNGVDIWIAPGVTIDYKSVSDPPTPGPTITDNGDPCVCNIYGYGKIKNTDNNSCIFIDHINSELTVECFSIDGSAGNSRAVYIKNANKFELECREVLSKGVALYLGDNNQNIIDKIVINVIRVETGDTTSSTTSGTSIVTYASGIIKILEILCKNRGHCFLHRAGNIIANIKKITTKYVMGPQAVSAVALIQDNIGTQKLVMYFDEINSIASNGAIEIAQGSGIFIGRRIFTDIGYAVSITQPFPTSTMLTFANLKCHEIESSNSAGVYISNVTNKVFLDADTILGYGLAGAVYGQGIADFLLKNATLRNRDTTSNSKCIVLEQPPSTNNIPNMTLNSVKAVTLNTSSGYIIFQAGFNGLTVKNFGLFANKVLEAGVTLSVGNASNFQFIVSPDLM